MDKTSLLIGIGIGAIIGSFFSMFILGTVEIMQLFLFIGVCIISFAIGYFIKRPKAPEIRLTGRVFAFPQAPVQIEASLRRMGSILPIRGVRSE